MESDLSSVEFDNDTRGKEHRKHVTKLDEVMCDNLHMALESSSFNGDCVSSNSEENFGIISINNQTDENIYFDKIEFNEIGEDFPGIDFTPAFPLSSPAITKLNPEKIEIQSDQNDERSSIFITSEDSSLVPTTGRKYEIM